MKWWKRIGLGVLALIALLFLWGVGIEPHLMLDVTHPDAPIPHLPAAWNGARVAVLGDVHVGMTLGNPGTAERAVRRVLRERPDLVLLTGDFVVGASGEPQAVDKAVGIVAPLPEAGIPTFSVLGNHDYAVAWRSERADTALAHRIARELESVGIPVLSNRAVALRRVARGDTGRIYLVGIGSNWAHDDHPVRALRGVPDDAARIVLMHNPFSFRAIPPGSAPFAVAGHTHGGDVRIPFTPHWSWLDLVEGRKVPADAWAWAGFGQPGNGLYVNRGIGNSALPLRINDPPELTIFTLRPAPTTP